MQKYSALRIRGPARKCLLSPHCTLWLLNLQKKGQSCTGLHHAFHHPKILLWVWESSVLFILSFCSADKFKRKLFYSIKINVNVSHILLQNQEYLKKTCSHHRRLFHSETWTTAWTTEVAVLFHKGCAFWDYFFNNLVANLGKSCSSKPSQHDCNSSIFTAQPQFLASTGLHPVWLLPLTEKHLQSVFLQILSLHMWPWFATSLQLQCWVWAICSVDRAKVITAGNHNSELQISTETISQ